MSTGEKPDRRAEERSHLARFLESLPGAPAGARDFGDKPDLVIHTETHRIGIEHPQVFPLQDVLGKPFPKEAESLDQRSVERAQQLFEERGGPALLVYVYVYFNDMPIRKADVPGIAERLSAVVPRIAPVGPGNWIEIESWSYNRTAPGVLPEQVEELFVIRPPRPDAESLWGVGRAGTVPDLTRERIQEAIDEKGAKLAEYRSRCEEMWLLLVAHGFSPATDLRLPEGFAETFTFGFDRVFYFHNFSGKVVELARAVAATRGGRPAV
jgi:hypothetical protein